MKTPKKSKKFATEDKTYAPLWERVKAAYPGEVSITCPPDLAARIQKAVTKEKDLDTEWPSKRYLKLTTKPYELEGRECGLTFKLVIYRERELATELILRT